MCVRVCVKAMLQAEQVAAGVSEVTAGNGELWKRQKDDGMKEESPRFVLHRCYFAALQ